MFFKKAQNIQLLPNAALSDWRKITIATWRKIGDPSVYGVLEFRAEPALAEIARLQEDSPTRISITHFFAKCVALTLNEHPELNSVLRFGRIYPRKEISLFFQAAHDPTGRDLSGILIRNADKKSVPEIAREMEQELNRLKAEGDRKTYPIKSFLGGLPQILVAPALWLSGFVATQLNIWFPFFGVPRDAFGSIMITNIGALGLDFGFAPLVPYSHVPCVISLCALADRPIVENGQVVAAKTIRICVTFDHRIIDGLHASRLAATLRHHFENPSAN